MNAFTALQFIFKELALIELSKESYSKNAPQWGKRMRKGMWQLGLKLFLFTNEISDDL